MLRILGSRKHLCDSVNRRDLLKVGVLGSLGLGMAGGAPEVAIQGADSKGSGNRTFGRAKSCILLYLYGSPSHLETFDMKPEAPVEVRGDLRPIASRLPGCDVCELLPHVAQVMDRVTVVRSLNHAFPAHSVSYSLTGLPASDGVIDSNPGDPRHWPFIGSVLSYLRSTASDDRGARKMPDNLGLPFPLSSQRPGWRNAGFQSSFLGGRWAPVWTQFRGKATHEVVRSAFMGIDRWEGKDPNLGIEPECRFEIAPESAPSAELTLDRFDRRRSLLEQFDRGRRQAEMNPTLRGSDPAWDLAFSLLTSERVRQALDVCQEPHKVREAYGMTLFGQSCLTARRLVEAGCQFVTVLWDEYGTNNTAWDTHFDHFSRMRGELLPGLDLAYARLIQDLDDRGMLDDTLVLCMSEFGRAPRISTNVPGGGRDHWSNCYTQWFAGGGVARGRIIGQSDRIGAYVVKRPVSPKHILATTYHLLGFDHHSLLRDRLGRPLPLVDGTVVTEMFE